MLKNFVSRIYVTRYVLQYKPDTGTPDRHSSTKYPLVFLFPRHPTVHPILQWLSLLLFAAMFLVHLLSQTWQRSQKEKENIQVNLEFFNFFELQITGSAPIRLYLAREHVQLGNQVVTENSTGGGVGSLRTADAFPVVASLSRKCVCCSQAKVSVVVGSTFGSAAGRFRGNTGPCRFFPGRNHPLAHLIHEVQFVSKLFWVNHIKSPPTESEQRVSDQERFLSRY